MNRALAGWLFLVSGAASAAPFLTCDPYPATGQQPTEFVVTLSGIAAPIVSPAVDVTGGKALKLDLGPLNLTGSRTVTAKARNAWGESATSSPLAFTAGAPAVPGGLGLSLQ
jgi:hypothetical protein